LSRVFTHWQRQHRISLFDKTQKLRPKTAKTGYNWLQPPGIIPNWVSYQLKGYASNLMNSVIIYTDGACTGNTGPGGYGAVIVNNRQRQELSGGFRLTTNNRMELTAAIEALKSLKSSSSVKLYSDSKYLVDAMTLGWVEQWKSNRWRNSSKQKVLNSDLWKEMLYQCNRHQLTFTWVQGHAGNRENERCDALSTTAARRKNLPPDKGYEDINKPAPKLF